MSLKYPKNHQPLKKPNKNLQMRNLIENIQQQLREKMLEDLWEDKDCLEEFITQPEIYFYKLQTYKEKYLDKLTDLQRIWNELTTLERRKKR